MKHGFSLITVCLLALVLFVSCSDDLNPVGPSPVTGTSSSTSLQTGTRSSVSTNEEFNCTCLEEVRARFTDPGFVNSNHVGLYVGFTGLPDGEYKLRIWWDYENDSKTYRDIRTIEIDENTFEKVIEHTYVNGRIGDKFQVRIELILKGKTGNCARNRYVTLTEETPTENTPCGDGICTVFITSQTFDGNLGGLAGADAKCQALAQAAGLSGSFRAWLSNGTASPSSRFTKAPVPYVLVDGTPIASDWDDLVDGTLDHHIDVTEQNSNLLKEWGAWTATLSDGTPSVKYGHCSGWTATKGGPKTLTTKGALIPTLPGGTGAAAGKDTLLWSEYKPVDCAYPLPLYCFEQ
jgi:hypothetical protein